MKSILKSAANLLYPLSEFYSNASPARFEAEEVEPDRIPEPYRSLLDHDRDMTPTLQAYHEDRIHLRVMESRIVGETLVRRVVLLLDGTDRPVEFGASATDLSLFDSEPREKILEGVLPLGAILGAYGIEHLGGPTAFIRLPNHRVLQEAFGLADVEDGIRYGRCNTLKTPEGGPIAQVVEILPLMDR